MKSTIPKGVKFPVVVERGPTGLKGRAKIFRAPTKAKGKKYESFTVEFYLAGERRRIRFNAYPKAFARAEEIATELSNGSQGTLVLSQEEQMIYQSSIQALKDLESTKLDSAIREYVEARKQLGGVSILEAAVFYKNQNRTALKQATLEEIQLALMATLEDAQRSDYHRNGVNRHTLRFMEKFKDRSIAEIQSDEITEWLKEIPGGGRNRDNHRNSVGNLFNFARIQGYLPRHLPTALEGTSAINEVGGENEVYAVEEAETLLSKAPDWLLPTLAIKLFSGIRTEEVFRMDWSAMKFDQNAIILSKKITKTKQRRIVPLLPNLKLWLSRFQESDGPIAGRWSSPKTMSCAWTQFAARVGVPYKKNAMRKSYISYRLAQIKNLATVALESGNSPEVIQRDYRELVTEDAAKRWFTISPAK